MERSQISSKVKRIKLEAQSLYDLADAFYQTGNATVADTLIGSADSIKNLAVGIMEDFDKDTQEQFDSTMKQMGKTLSAAVNKD